MKVLRWIPLAMLVSAATASANGVAIVDKLTNTCLTLVRSSVHVSVEGQVATVAASQTFRNELSTDTTITYGFPVPEDAGATGLAWEIGGLRYDAVISPVPQDTTGYGEGQTIAQNLYYHLSKTPLLFPIEQAIPKDSTIWFEVRYVELLPFRFGAVDFTFPGDYRKISSKLVDAQDFAFELRSARPIVAVELLSGQPVAEFANDGTNARLRIEAFESIAGENYRIRYRLGGSGLSATMLSTRLPDSLTADSLGGFFLLMVDPDPQSDAGVIDKAVSILIDNSESMRVENRIGKAKAAAAFVIDNLNDGDLFNVTDFNNSAHQFRNALVPATATNRTDGKVFLNRMIGEGGTGTSWGFDAIIHEFAGAPEGYANIVIFLTDGYPTKGVYETDQLVAHVESLIDLTGRKITVFPFGIGSWVNTQLLTLLAARTGGVAEFLGENDIETRIAEFYLTIQNPMLLDTRIDFSVPLAEEPYPNPLPHLYGGRQIAVAGRYLEPSPVGVVLRGGTLEDSARYEFAGEFSGEAVDRAHFLPRIWAKRKIEHLLVHFYTADAGSQDADSLKAAIVALSVAWGVISPFTSFEAPTTPIGPAAIEEEADYAAEAAGRARFELLGNAPNPFNPSTVIRLRVNVAFAGIVPVRIYNALGQVVATLSLRVQGPGYYEIVWDGRMADGRPAASGVYIYVLDFGDHVLAGRMEIVR